MDYQCLLLLHSLPDLHVCEFWVFFSLSLSFFDCNFTSSTLFSPAMSTASDSALGMGGSDSRGFVWQPMIEQEVVPIGDSSSE